MKVKLIGRKVYLPKELIEKAGLPENGEAEAILVGDEVMLRKDSKKAAMNTVKILQRKPISVPIERMVEAQETEDA